MASATIEVKMLDFPIMKRICRSHAKLLKAAIDASELCGSTANLRTAISYAKRTQKLVAEEAIKSRLAVDRAQENMRKEA